LGNVTEATSASVFDRTRNTEARNVMGLNQLVLVITPVVFNGTKKKDKLVK